MPVTFKDYYKVLGVERTATAEEIQKAFRKLARKHHPDVSKAAGAEDRFKEINEAYEVLKDPETRKKYDTLGANWKSGQEFQPPPGWENVQFNFGTRGANGQAGMEDAAGFSDFFRMLFGGGGFGQEDYAGDPFGGFRAAAGGSRGGWSARGEDQTAEIEVTLEEAFRGAKRRIELETHPADIRHSGRPERRSFDVTIPAGVAEGSRIRLAGQGGKGAGGGPDGDLYLRIRLAPHPVFTAHEHDLRTTVRLAPWEAALGADVKIPTLDGGLTLKIKPGTQGGQTLRLRGKGLPRRQGGHGDMLATVQIAVPQHLSHEERRLFEELRKESGFKPRS